MEAFLKEHPFITGVIIGEGEKTFSELCRYYVKGEGSLEEMKGIALLMELEMCRFMSHRKFLI